MPPAGRSTGRNAPRGEQLGVGGVLPQPVEQAHHGILGAPKLGLQVGVKAVRERQVRVEREGAPERTLRRLVRRACVGLQVLANHPMRPAEPRPCGGRVGVVLQTPLVHCLGHAVRARFESQLVRSQVQLVRSRRRRNVHASSRSVPDRQRLANAATQRVVQLEEISERRMRAVRPEDAPAWCIHELHADAELICAVSRAGSEPRRRRSASVSPVNRSITMNGRPDSSPSS